jgi:hypothetical protein
MQLELKDVRTSNESTVTSIPLTDSPENGTVGIDRQRERGAQSQREKAK